MRTAQLRVVKVAETRFVLDDREGMPWAVWATDAADAASALVEFAGRACYQSWQRPNPATRANADYLAHLLAQKHYSVLEHAGFTVMLTGVSRSFTHEMVRHRHFSFSQLSQRFVSEDDAPWVIPPLFRDDPEALAVLQDLYDRIQQAYQALAEIGARKLQGLPDRTLRRKRAREAARCVLPNMTETHIVITGNHRAWREFFEKRGELHVDQEMREVAVTIFREVARPLAPALYRDFRIRVVSLPTGPVEVLERDPSLLEGLPAPQPAPGGG
jgi:thymidylate synthase (FAD)